MSLFGCAGVVGVAVCEVVVDSAELGCGCAVGECTNDFACAHVVDLDLVGGVCVHRSSLSYHNPLHNYWVSDPVLTRVGDGWQPRRERAKILKQP